MNQNEFDELLDAYLLNEASAVQRAQLQELLKGEPEARRRFVELTQLEARLHVSSGSAVVAIPKAVRVAAAKPARRLFQRGVAGLRRFDLAAVAVLGTVALVAYYVLRPNIVPPAPVVVEIAAAGDGPSTVEPEQTGPPVRAEGDAQATEGWIQSLDLNAKTFVLRKKDESRTTFRVAVLDEGKRERSKVLFDGKPATFEDAIQPQRKAVVTFVQFGNDEPWVWKVEVLSATR